MEESVSMWKKTASELTVGESLKISAVITVGSMVVAVGVMMACAGAASAVEKIQQKRQDRKDKTAEQ